MLSEEVREWCEVGVGVGGTELVSRPLTLERVGNVMSRDLHACPRVSCARTSASVA